MALDANNGYFSLAYGVVEKENRDNWGYFFKALKVCLQDTELSKYTFISNRHKVCTFSCHFVCCFCRAFPKLTSNEFFIGVSEGSPGDIFRMQQKNL